MILLIKRNSWFQVVDLLKQIGIWKCWLFYPTPGNVCNCCKLFNMSHQISFWADISTISNVYVVEHWNITEIEAFIKFTYKRTNKSINPFISYKSKSSFLHFLHNFYRNWEALKHSSSRKYIQKHFHFCIDFFWLAQSRLETTKTLSFLKFYRMNGFCVFIAYSY